MTKTVSLLSCLLFLMACNQSSKTTVKARVIERKQVANNKLMLAYAYQYQGQMYTDTATIDNKVIPNDSIDVVLEPQNPLHSKPSIP